MAAWICASCGVAAGLFDRLGPGAVLRLAEQRREYLLSDTLLCLLVTLAAAALVAWLKRPAIARAVGIGAAGAPRWSSRQRSSPGSLPWRSWGCTSGEPAGQAFAQPAARRCGLSIGRRERLPRPATPVAALGLARCLPDGRLSRRGRAVVAAQPNLLRVAVLGEGRGADRMVFAIQGQPCDGLDPALPFAHTPATEAVLSKLDGADPHSHYAVFRKLESLGYSHSQIEDMMSVVCSGRRQGEPWKYLLSRFERFVWFWVTPNGTFRPRASVYHSPWHGSPVNPAIESENLEKRLIRRPADVASRLVLPAGWLDRVFRPAAPAVRAGCAGRRGGRRRVDCLAAAAGVRGPLGDLVPVLLRRYDRGSVPRIQVSYDSGAADGCCRDGGLIAHWLPGKELGTGARFSWLGANRRNPVILSAAKEPGVHRNPAEFFAAPQNDAPRPHQTAELLQKLAPSDVWVVIAAYNEERRIGNVLDNLLRIARNVAVVNDGSRDETAQQVLRRPVWLLQHAVNLGQGESLQTGISFALRQGAEYIANVDADGQHDPADIPAMLDALRRSGADYALGSRFLGGVAGVPLLRKLVLRSAVLFTRITSGVSLTDAHNGIRLMTRRASTHSNHVESHGARLGDRR